MPNEQVSDKVTSPRPAVSAALFTAAVIAATWVQLQRQRAAPLYDVMWAEDGRIFLSDALRGSFVETIARPYNGYMHAVPRAIASITEVFPLDYAAWLFAVGSGLLVSLLAAFVYVASAPLLTQRWQRATLVAFMVLPPVGWETYANASNLHWYLMFASFWALVFVPRSKLMMTLSALVVFMATLSDPLNALLVPIGVIVVIRYKSRRHLVVMGALFAGLLLQGIVVLGADVPDMQLGFEASELLGIFGVRAAGGLLIGDRFLTSFWLRLAWALPVAALAAVVISVVVALRRTTGWRQFAVASAATYSVLFFLVPTAVRGTSSQLTVGEPVPLTEPRYFVIPVLLLASLVLSLPQRREPLAHNDRAGPRAMHVLVVIWAAAVLVPNYASDPRPAPRWQQELEIARNSCTVSPFPSQRAPIAPAIPDSPWYVEIPCPRPGSGSVTTLPMAFVRSPDRPPAPAALLEVVNARVVLEDPDCVTVAASAFDPQVVLTITNGGTLTLTSDRSGIFEAFLAGDAGFAQEASISTETTEDEPVWLLVDAAPGVPRLLRVDPPDGSTLSVCADYR